MRAITLLTSLLLVCSLSPAMADSAAARTPQDAIASIPDYAPDRVLVKFRPGTAASAIGAAHRKADGRSLRIIPHIDVHVVKVAAGSVAARVALYRANPNVEYAEPDYYRVMVLPEEGADPPPPTGSGTSYFEEQWGLQNVGQLLTDPMWGTQSLSGTPDADIDAPEGWDISTGLASVKIGILDTGIDCAAIELNGKCVEQISFVTDFTGTLDDELAHGTHVAGTAGAHTDNGIGVAGVGWNASLGNLKACFPYDLIPPLGIYYVGVCPVSSSASAMIYAADHGYHVVNMSYASDVPDEGGGLPTPSAPPNAETDAVAYAWSQGMVLVAAAGNDSTTTQVYPAAYDDVIAVGATDRYDNLASFSNFNNSWVSLLAPGENILSVEPDISCSLIPGYTPGVDDCLSWKSGTSMASPHVAGAAALLWAQLYPGQSPQDCVASSGMPCNTVVRDHLQNGADASGALGQNFLAWSQHGRLNLYGMLSDGDGDGILSPTDNCPDIANAAQANNDGDAAGDACDSDDDNDGLDDATELSLGTDPFLVDSDGDTLSDFDEVSLGSNPLNIDSDGDGLRDDSDPIPLTFNFNDGDLAPLGAPDGLVNVADYLIAQRIVSGALMPTLLEYAHGDLHPVGAPDGVIDLSDLILLQQQVLQ